MKLKKLRSENHLNKVVKQARQSKQATMFFITSPWDLQGKKIIQELDEAYEEAMIDFYEVDYFELPHAFVIFKSKVPGLVCVDGKVTRVYDNPMSIRAELGLDTLAVPQTP
jgi:DNA-binding sugar fermentation-stimulating protein